MTTTSPSTRAGSSLRTDPAEEPPRAAIEGKAVAGAASVAAASAGTTSSAIDRSPGVAPAAAADSPHNERFYTHQLTVLSVSSGMVGVCLTAIGLIGIRQSIGGIESIVDDILAVGSLLFMVTALFSFFAMRTRLSKTWRGIERAIDVVFCLGLVLVVMATAMLTWEVF
jgi:hypothetical protein